VEINFNQMLADTKKNTPEDVSATFYFAELSTNYFKAAAFGPQNAGHTNQTRVELIHPICYLTTRSAARRSE
jgi:hypothetical protein